MLNLGEISWDCVHFTKNDAPSIEGHGSKALVFSLDASAISNEATLLRSVAKAMSFPDYFGNNWDAMDECLSDMEWAPSQHGYILLISSSVQLWQQSPLAAGKLVQSWLCAAECWAKDGKPFHLVFADM